MSSTQHVRDLERGRDCYSRRAWDEAYVALLRADEVVPLAADDLDHQLENLVTAGITFPVSPDKSGMEHITFSSN